MVPSPQRAPYSAVRLVRVTAEDASQRIDNYLIRQFKGVPKSHLYKVLRKGEVRVNKRRVKPAYKLQEYDEVRLPPVRYFAAKFRQPPEHVLSLIRSRISYEDERLFVINKPSGLAVHAGTGVDYGVIDALNALYPLQRSYLVHRLDRETSGCLLIARDRQAMLLLQAAIRDSEVDKCYAALLMGSWGKGRQVVDMPLRQNRIQDGERQVRVSANSKQAVSIFHPVCEYSGYGKYTAATFMKIRLITGRTHQIRLHALQTGHPLAGDRRYGHFRFNSELGKFGLKRMFLHAESLTFPHPDDARKMYIKSPLDDDLSTVLQRLEKR